MRIILSFWVILFFPLEALSFECNGHVKFGIPSASDQLLCRSGYAVGYSYSKKGPLWTAYKLTRGSVAQDNGRGGNPFKEDDEIPPQYRSTDADYKEPVYDRGHLAPRAAIDFSPQSRDETFLYSNMAPQLPGFNRQGWRYLEGYVRKWAEERDEIYVVTGSIFQDGAETIGNGVHVPTAFYKVVFDPETYDAIAFVLPHRKIKKKEIPNFITSVDEVERLTGCDFNAVLQDDQEAAIESVVEEMW